MQKPLFIPLPRGWARRIQQALLHAVGLERLALAEARAGFEHSPDPRARMAAEMDRLRELVELQAEELRILRARLAHIPAQKRPHYPPPERLAILMLCSKTGWNAAKTARRFVVTPATIGTWMRRLDEEGEDALVKTPVPINRYGDGVTLLAHELHRAAPGFGRRMLADILARAGLQLAASTLRRMLNKKPSSRPPREPPRTKKVDDPKKGRVVTARRAHHVWHVDITSIAIGAPGAGAWVPWFPFALVLRWALSWHLALVVDHFSRAFVAFAVFRREPTAAEVCELLSRAVEKTGAAPRYVISDRGSQFRDEYQTWCKRNGVRPRFGAIGKKGSIAVVERFTLSLKRELLWKIVVPVSFHRMVAAVAAYQRWYNEERPHTFLAGRTPVEVRDGLASNGHQVRFEARARVPLARGDPNVKRCGKLELCVSYAGGFRELPVVELREAA